MVCHLHATFMVILKRCIYLLSFQRKVNLFKKKTGLINAERIVTLGIRFHHRFIHILNGTIITL